MAFGECALNPRTLNSGFVLVTGGPGADMIKGLVESIRSFVARVYLCLPMPSSTPGMPSAYLSKPPGFRREGVLVMQLLQQPGRDKIPNRTVYYRQLAENLSRLPESGPAEFHRQRRARR
jgi:hypothetical protein